MPFDHIPMNRRLFLGGAAALGLAGHAPRLESSQATRLPRTQAVLDAMVAEGRLPGATVGVQAPDGSSIFIQAGKLAFGGAAAMDRDTLFRIYSMTKPITGTATALLIEDGVLTLDQPVADFIPEFAHMTVSVDPENSLEARPAEQVMTIRHLLTHSSGLTYGFMGPAPLPTAYRQRGIRPYTGDLDGSGVDAPSTRTLEEMVARLAELPLQHEPGAAMTYSVSLDVLGLVIQRASGMSFPDFMQRRLFDPIGMRDTIWRLRPGDEERLASLYIYSEGAEPTISPSGTPADYARADVMPSGGAGLVSSTRDYLAYLTTLMNDGRAGNVRVMKPETARLIRTNIMPEAVDLGGGDGHGFGGRVVPQGHRRQGEFGWGGAASTQGWFDPEQNFAAVLMIQAMPYGVVDLLEPLRPTIDADLGIVRAG